MPVKYITLLALQLFIFEIVFSQNRIQAEKVLKELQSFNEIDSLKRAYPKWEIKGETIASTDTVNFPFIKKPAVGVVYKKILDNNPANQYLVKILSQETQHLCRVNYIFLDGEKLDDQEIDSIRTEVHRRVQRGEKFKDIIGEYTMDGGTGDIGWISKEMVVDEFFTPIQSKSKGEVFDVSIPENRWFYIVHKTHENLIQTYFYTVWLRIK